MTKPYVEYKSGYKYQIVKEYRVEVGVTPENNIKTDYIELTTGGALIIKKGYAWDGPSGPTFDTPNFMRGSLVHDALYQLLRLELLEQKWRDEADDELRVICRQDGMSWLRAWWVHKGVRFGGGPAASPQARKRVHKAP